MKIDSAPSVNIHPTETIMTNPLSNIQNLNLEENHEGVLVAKDLPAISYPEDGNRACFALENDSYWFQHRNNVLGGLVARYSPNKLFFDIGGGNGCVSQSLQSRGFDVALVEPGPEGAINAKRRGVTTVIQATLETAGFRPNSLPAAGVFDVVEHIENDEQFVKSLHNYLAPEGYLFVTVPAYNFLWSNDDIYAGHYRRYTRQSLNRLLMGVGFEIDYSGYLFSFLVPPIMLSRTLPSVLGFRKSISQETTSKEHSSGSGLAQTLLARILDWEIEKVKAGARIPIGSSVVAVARKQA